MTTKETIEKMIGSWKPNSDRYLIIPEEKKKQTSTGIILADNKVGEDKTQRGRIIAVGPGKMTDECNIIPMNYSIGDIVLMEKHAGSDISIDENLEIFPAQQEITDALLPLRIIRQESILLLLSHATS